MKIITKLKQTPVRKRANIQFEAMWTICRTFVIEAGRATARIAR